MGGSGAISGRLSARNQRKVLCVSPVYARSFGTFEHAYSFRGTRAFMPPQGLLVIAAALPENWEVRFIDENMAPAHASDFVWADVVFVSGMHIQRRADRRHQRTRASFRKVDRARRAVRLGLSRYYPDFDYLHVGELGDATAGDRRAPSTKSASARGGSCAVDTVERVPLQDFPIPAYHLADLESYFIGNVQFSSGCPYQCEFCDIPALYGRNPRLKRPSR